MSAYANTRKLSVSEKRLKERLRTMRRTTKNARTGLCYVSTHRVQIHGICTYRALTYKAKCVLAVTTLPVGFVYVPLQCMRPGRVNTPTENVHYFIKPRPSSTDPSTANLPTIATLSQYKQFGSLTTASGIASKQGVHTQFNTMQVI